MYAYIYNLNIEIKTKYNWWWTTLLYVAGDIIAILDINILLIPIILSLSITSFPIVCTYILHLT